MSAGAAPVPVTGTVVAGEPAVDLVFVAPDGARLTRVALIDTGFDGTVALPSLLFTKLARGATFKKRITVADGRTIDCDAAVVGLVLCGAPREVVAVRLGRGAVLGMTLLTGHRLTVDCRDGGPVTIAPLPQ